MHQAYRELLLARAAAAVAEAAALRGVNHKGLKGQLRETLIRLLLRPLFPPRIGVGTGEVITHRGQTSTQQDVVVFDKSEVPPLLVGEEGGLFPLESLIYTIEVKSVLNAEELRRANESARSIDMALKDLTYILEDHAEPPTYPRPLSALFAFESDAKDKDELERYFEQFKPEDQKLQILCVVGKGCWANQRSDKWIEWPRTQDHEEILGFLGVLLNSLEPQLRKPRTAKPGQYFTNAPPRSR